jgi:hypothetical protein
VVNLTVRSYDFLYVNRKRLSREIRNPAAGFLENDEAGGRIPRMKIQFPEAVAPACGNVAEISTIPV